MFNDYIKMLTLIQMDLGCLILRANTEVLFKDMGDIVSIVSDGIELSITKELLKDKTNRSINELFISKEDAESATTYGSEIQLLTDRGLCTYSVENISFENNAYATLSLKIV